MFYYLIIYVIITVARECIAVHKKINENKKFFINITMCNNFYNYKKNDIEYIYSNFMDDYYGILYM